MVSIFLLYGLPNLYIQSQSLHLWCNLIMEVVSHPFYWLGGGYRSPHKYTTKKMVIHGQESLGVLLGFCLSHWPSNVSVQLPPISEYLKHYRYRQMMFKSKSKIFASILALPPLFQSSVNINPITQVKKKHGDDVLFLISSHHSHSDNTKLNWSPSSIFTASGLIRQWSSSTWTGTVIFKSLFRQVPTRIVSPTQIHMGVNGLSPLSLSSFTSFYKHYRNVAMSIFCEDGIKLSKLDTARLSSQDNNFETEGTA